MFEGLKAWWQKATAAPEIPKGTGRIGFVVWVMKTQSCPWSRVHEAKAFGKSLELERIGPMSKMLALEGIAERHEEWVPTKLVIWVVGPTFNSWPTGQIPRRRHIAKSDSDSDQAQRELKAMREHDRQEDQTQQAGVDNERS